MDEFTKSLGSIGWWLGVVLVGIILNVLSAYLKPALDASFSKVSSWWRNRSEQDRETRARLVAELRNDKHKQVLVLAEEMRRRLRSIAYLIFSLMLLLTYIFLQISFSLSVSTGTELSPFSFRQFVFLLSLVFVFFCMTEHAGAIACKSLVLEAQEDHVPER